MLGKILRPIIEYKMKKRDKRLLVEAAILTGIYLLSFAVLSLGRVQQTFFGFSEFASSTLQMFILTFLFAIIITMVIYYIYKRIHNGY